MKTKMLLLFCLTLTTKGIWAQDEVKELPGEVFRELQFNFATPGARASGMGRAFIGLAEDATAAVSNPAGLLNLTRPQVYFEGKLTELRSRRLAERGAFNTLEVSNFYQTTVSFSFINFAIPVGERVVLAFTRHEFLNFEERFVLGDRAFPGDCKNDWNGNGVPDAGDSGDCTPSLFAVRGQGEESARVDFRGESFGGSIAYQLYETLSIGLLFQWREPKVSWRRVIMLDFPIHYVAIASPLLGDLPTSKVTALRVWMETLSSPVQTR